MARAKLTASTKEKWTKIALLLHGKEMRELLYCTCSDVPCENCPRCRAVDLAKKVSDAICLAVMDADNR